MLVLIVGDFLPDCLWSFKQAAGQRIEMSQKEVRCVQLMVAVKQQVQADYAAVVHTEDSSPLIICHFSVIVIILDGDVDQQRSLFS